MELPLKLRSKNPSVLSSVYKSSYFVDLVQDMIEEDSISSYCGSTSGSSVLYPSVVFSDDEEEDKKEEVPKTKQRPTRKAKTAANNIIKSARVHGVA